MSDFWLERLAHEYASPHQQAEDSLVTHAEWLPDDEGGFRLCTARGIHGPCIWDSHLNSIEKLREYLPHFAAKNWCGLDGAKIAAMMACVRFNLDLHEVHVVLNDLRNHNLPYYGRGR